TADFVKPDSVVELEIEKGSDPPALAGPLTSSDNVVKELFVKGTEPNKVSDKHDKLDSVSDLQATFNEADDSIDISWDYESEIDVTFDVSYKVDDGEYTSLTNTDETKADINSVEEGSTYTIKVVAVSEEDSDLKSDEATTTVETGDEAIPKVTGLSAEYNESNQSLDISWEYDGPDATFEVKINDDTQSVQEKNVEVSGVSPGNTYDIIVTPIVDDEKGPSSQTSITIDDEEEDSEDETEDDKQDENNEEEEEDEQEKEDTDTEDSNDVNDDENNDETDEEDNDEDIEEDEEQDIQESNENDE